MCGINAMPTASHRYSLFYWNTTTDRLAPKTDIVNISQWQSVLHRSISLSCYISEKLVVTQFCRLGVPYVAAWSAHPDWKRDERITSMDERAKCCLKRAATWNPQINKAHDLSMCRSRLILELLLARWKLLNLNLCVMQDLCYKIFI